MYCDAWRKMAAAVPGSSSRCIGIVRVWRLPSENPPQFDGAAALPYERETEASEDINYIKFHGSAWYALMADRWSAECPIQARIVELRLGHNLG